jgi:hypothetical protein
VEEVLQVCPAKKEVLLSGAWIGRRGGCEARWQRRRAPRTARQVRGPPGDRRDTGRRAGVEGDPAGVSDRGACAGLCG